jgi:cholesterol oxidase
MADAVDVDVVVVGSGFGGSVAALRLVEKGYRVTVIEAGRRWADHELPRTSWDIRKFVWAPVLGLHGIQRIVKVGKVMVLAGAGVGGGSLNYANTLYKPPPAFFKDRHWADITDWEAELSPWYDQASRMLGVTQNPTVTRADEIMREVATEMGVRSTFRLTPVGVFFGAEGAQSGCTVDDPYFGGAGPARTACTECGSCMTGCRVGAKNSLVKNYLHLAEQAGATIVADTTVTELREEGDHLLVTTRRTGPLGGRRTVIRTQQVVLAAGTLGTQRLLHRLRDKQTLPRLSDRLGHLTRTNSESLRVSSTWTVKEDLTQGVAITSSFHPDAETHVESVRYGKGSNAMAYVTTVGVPGQGRAPRWLRGLFAPALHPLVLLRTLLPHRWSERSVIALVMQTLDNSVTTRLRLGRLTSQQGHGAPNPSWIPAGDEVAQRVTSKLGGYTTGTIGELVNVPMTAHFIGGCTIGDSPQSGVIDPYHRLWGHPAISVVDGSTITANLGVNPSLTITAQAERALSLWPNKGAEDLRPTQGQAYQRLDPIPPHHPTVPQHAFGALWTARPVVPRTVRPAERAEIA